MSAVVWMLISVAFMLVAFAWMLCMAASLGDEQMQRALEVKRFAPDAVPDLGEDPLLNPDPEKVRESLARQDRLYRQWERI